MADTTTTTYELKIESLFADGDTRVLTLKNPKDNITGQEITELNALILNQDETAGTPLLVGDRTGAEFTRINTVVNETRTVTNLDLATD